MAEQFSEKFDLFSIPGVVQEPFTRGPNGEFQLQLLRFVDGRIQIQGQAYVDSTLSGIPIANNQVLFKFTDTGSERLNQIFAGGADNYQEGFIMMGAVDGSSALLNMAVYRRSQAHITYNTTTLGAAVLADKDWTFSGWIWPNGVPSTSSLIWGS